MASKSKKSRGARARKPSTGDPIAAHLVALREREAATLRADPEVRAGVEHARRWEAARQAATAAATPFITRRDTLIAAHSGTFQHGSPEEQTLEDLARAIEHAWTEAFKAHGFTRDIARGSQRVGDLLRMTPDSFISEAELAQRCRVNRNTLRRHLRDWRPRHLNNDWIRVRDRRPTDPTYLYRCSAVAQVVDQLTT